MIKEIWLKAQILIIGSLSFVIALAWNDAFQNLFERVPYLKKKWSLGLCCTNHSNGNPNYLYATT